MNTPNKPLYGEETGPEQSGTPVATTVTQEKTVTILALQQDSVYISALNRISQHILSNIQNCDFTDFTLSSPLTRKQIVSFFYIVGLKDVESIVFSSEEMEKISLYFKVKNGENFDGMSATTRLFQVVTLATVDVFTGVMVTKNYGIDAQKIKSILLLSMQVDSITFATTARNFVTKVGSDVRETDIEDFRTLYMKGLTTLTPHAPRACPFFKSPEKLAWIDKLWLAIEVVYLPKFVALQNDTGDNLHDFYSGRYIQKLKPK